MRKEIYINESQAKLITSQLILESHMGEVIGKIIKRKYPKFNKENTYISETPELKFYSTLNFEPNLGGEFEILYTIYNDKERTLKFDGELFDYVEGIVGIEDAHHMIDWFNEEFGTDAENIIGFL